MRYLQKVSSHVIWKIETFIEEDTSYKKHCTQDNNTSIPFKVGTLRPHIVLPITISCPVIFSWISLMVWISSLSKVILVLGKARSHRASNLGSKGSESPGWFDVLPKISAQNMVQERACCHGVAANHQNSFHRGMFSITQNFIQIHSSTCSVILNVMATQ